MSEHVPLLPSSSTQHVSRREKTAEFLESNLLHKLVLSLGPDAPAWLDALAHVSLAITSFFLLEIPLSLWALGSRFYSPRGGVPHAALHLFDAFIIITTFVLEVVLKGREQELAGLLVILRLWRLIKLVGGVTVGVGEVGEEDAVQLADTMRQLDQVNKENEALRAKLEAAGIH
ncbi:hypothetical protein B0H10DRAFT_2160101 [Mycena sp. CBHHK59/15]|nr:hypothetical protein B0H10DRAFT_2160101 [Mycena sp. CBHHK59/15]